MNKEQITALYRKFNFSDIVISSDPHGKATVVKDEIQYSGIIPIQYEVSPYLAGGPQMITVTFHADAIRIQREERFDDPVPFRPANQFQLKIPYKHGVAYMGMGYSF